MPIFNMFGGGSSAKFLLTESGDVGYLMKPEKLATNPLTASAEQDIRDGKIAVTMSGIVEGTKNFPSYETTESKAVILPGMEYRIHLPLEDQYDYTSFQAIFCTYNTTEDDSVAAERVAIMDNVYNVGETSVFKPVTKDDESKTIYFGFSNETENSVVIRYFTYREVE